MRFLKAAGIAVTASIVVVYLVSLKNGDTRLDAVVLVLGAVPSLIGILVGGGLFRLVRWRLPTPWHTRIPCALWSCLLSVAAITGMFLWVAGHPSGDGEVEGYVVLAGMFFLAAPIAAVVGAAFGAGVGQTTKSVNSEQ